MTAGNLIYNTTVLSIKLSVVLLYHRLFSIDRKANRILNGFMVFLTCFYVAQICVSIAVVSECDSIPQPTLCVDLWKNTVVQSCVNVLTDFAVLAYPIVKVSRLQMTLRRKFRVSAVFAIGLL